MFENHKSLGNYSDQIKAGVSVETLSRAYDHTESADYILEMTKHDYTGFDQMEAQT